MNKYNKIIFLDEENTALGPLAQEMLRRKLEQENCYSFLVLSRGNVVLFPEPVNQKVEALARADGLDLSGHTAKQMEAEDFEEGTLVLALDSNSKIKAYSKYENAANVYTLREFAGEQGDIKFQIGKDIAEYADTYTLLDRTVEIIKDKLTENQEDQE